jgi:hypothetical protein
MKPGDTETMNSQAGLPYLLGRVFARAGAGVWRNRGGVLVCGVIVAALAGYLVMTGATLVPSAQQSFAAADADCADTAMAAIADKSPAASQKAYQCMDSTFQQRVSEADFVRQMQSQRMPNVSKLARVGDYRSTGGGTMVYYALDGGNQAVGYIVYLGQNGKVLRIE